jgi:hypothetical protein
MQPCVGSKHWLGPQLHVRIVWLFPGAQVQPPISQVLGKSPVFGHVHEMVVTVPPVDVHSPASPASSPASLAAPPVPAPPAPAVAGPLLALPTLAIAPPLPLLVPVEVAAPGPLLVVEPAAAVALPPVPPLPQPPACASASMATSEAAMDVQ